MTGHQIDWGDEGFTPVPPDPKKRASPERSVHVAIKRFIETVLPDALVVWVRNEMLFPAWIDSRDYHAKARYIAKLKVQGYRPGMPDLLVIMPGGRTVFFEVKPATGGSVSAEQKAVHMRLACLGHFVAVVRSIDDVRAWLARWSIQTREATCLNHG